MKRKFYFILFFCIGICGLYAQETLTSYDGQTFKEGSRFKIGYHYISSSKYTTIKEGYTDNYAKKRYKEIEEGELPLSEVMVQKVLYPENTNIFYDKEPILVVQSGVCPDKEIYIHINKAIERGEVITAMMEKPLIENSVELTLDQMFACCVRVNKLPVDDNVLLNYIRTLDKKLGQECTSDKFKFEKVKADFKAKLEKAMGEFDFSKVYRVQVNNYLDSYDFTKKGYPVSYNLQENSVTRNFILCQGFNFLIENKELASFLPVSTELAEKYETRRKGANKQSYVNSLVYSTLYLTLKDKRMDIPKDKLGIINVENLYRSTLIGAEIRGVEVYDHPSCRYNLIGKIEGK